MPPQEPRPISTREALELLDEMIVQQRTKCLKIARRLNPHLTPDDIMNSFDWPELRASAEYVWQDGIAAGLESAHAAIAAAFRECRPDPEYKVRRFATMEDGGRDDEPPGNPAE